MKKYFKILFFVCFFFIFQPHILEVKADNVQNKDEKGDMAQNESQGKKYGHRFAGKFLLQVDDGGRIWYVSPQDDTAYEVQFHTALPFFEKVAVGITNADLAKIPIHPLSLLENVDSDNDGYSDRDEAYADYNPFGKGKLSVNKKFASNLKGKILLQVEDKGRIWYVDFDGYRSELRWDNIMEMFQKLANGIDTPSLNKFFKGTPFDFKAPEKAINCVNSLDCIREAAKRCVKSYGTFYAQYEPESEFDMDSNFYYFDYEVLGGEPEFCQVQVKMKKIISSYNEESKEQLRAMYRSFGMNDQEIKDLISVEDVYEFDQGLHQGKQCVFPYGQIKEFFDDTKKGLDNIFDNTQNCEGLLIEEMTEEEYLKLLEVLQ